MIHRDSPSSPFFNPSSSPSERLSKVFLRSHERAKYIKSVVASNNSPSSVLLPDGGIEYLINYTLGTPPVPILAAVDTGSDLIWTQCAPCENCFRQDAPLFDPSKSTTYKEISCGSTQCDSLPQASCDDGSNTCQYDIEYGDKSYSHGKVAFETLGLGSSGGTPVSFSEITIGCGFNNAGTFSAKDTGIFGLGNGPLSFISQLSSSIHGKFSYCLDRNGPSGITSGQINFGDNAVVSGGGVVSTAIHIGDPNTFYTLRLNGLSVGSQKIDFRRKSSTTSNSDDAAIDIIIDSGTTFTYLPSDLYNQLLDGVKQAVHAQPVADPKGLLDLCYDTTTGVKFPGLTAHFDGADVELSDYNIFTHTSKDVVCLTFSSAVDIAIYGNIAQIGFLVGYDLVKGVVSFKPNGCDE